MQEAEARGENYDRVKLLEVTAEDADRLERKRKKKNPDQGFSGIQMYVNRKTLQITHT